jgi:cob(I)alamin adenosyltransferase
MKNGLVHIYTGDGKGKTTASIGLGMRALGRGFKVLMVQFLKGNETGEMFSLKKHEPDFFFYSGIAEKKFTWEMNEGELESCKANQNKNFEFAKKELESGKWDMVILDEILAAVNAGMIDLNQLKQLVEERPKHIELIITGRDAPPELIELADYVSEIKEIKHPMTKGVKPRQGIED